MIIVLCALLDVCNLMLEVFLRPESPEASLVPDSLVQRVHVNNGQLQRNITVGHAIGLLLHRLIVVRLLPLRRVEDVAALLGHALLPRLTKLQEPLLRLLVASVHGLEVQGGREKALGLEVPRRPRAARQRAAAPVTLLLRLSKLITVWYVLCRLHELPFPLPA